MDDAAGIIRKTLREVRVGPPLSDREGRLPQVTIYPILPARLDPAPPGVIALSDGGRVGALIEEVSCEDAVRISNPLPVSLYGGESECLVGRTQNRALKHDVYVPPRTSRYALVNCVERGQPTRHGKGFAVDAVCPWSIRLDKMRQMARDGRIDQSRVWDQVEGFLRRAQVSSPTQDLHAAFEKREPEVTRALKSFPCLPGQVGVLASIGPNLYLDLFSEPEVLERRFEGVLSSVLMEGVIGRSDVRVPPEVAQRALEDLLAGAQASRSFRPRFSSPNDRDVLIWSREATASAFLGKGGLRHLAAHWAPGRTEIGDRTHAQRLGEFRSAYLAENRDWLAALRETYAPRRRSYDELVAGLSAGWAAWRTKARLLRPSAGPFPGPLLGVEEEPPVPDRMCFPEAGVIASAVACRTSRVTESFSADLSVAEALLEGLKLKI